MNKIYEAMREMTKEEKFWISCGWQKIKMEITAPEHLVYLNKVINGGVPQTEWWCYGDYITQTLPSVNSLDDLFKYAVPVAIERLMRDKSLVYQKAIRYLFQAWFIELRDSTKYAQALYLVLQKAIGGEK